MIEPDDDLTADEPWPEPRGPRLPDALRVLPWPAWIFVLLAIGRFWWGLEQAYFGAGPDPSLVAQFVLFSIPSVVAVLLPASLLARHPDSFSRARMLLVGTVLLAAVEGFVILRQPLQPFLEGIAPARDATTAVPAGVIAYGILVDVLSVVGLVATGAGLARARRYEDRGPTRLAVLVLVVAGLVASSGRIVAFSQEAFGNTDITPSLAAYLSTGFTLGVVGVAALVYLATELVRGDLAGEEPRLGWRLGALGLGLITLTVAFNTVILFYPVQPGQVGLSPAVYPIALGEAVGWLGLLVGVALGLPALDEPGEPEGSLTDAGPDDSVG